MILFCTIACIEVILTRITCTPSKVEWKDVPLCSKAKAQLHFLLWLSNTRLINSPPSNLNSQLPDTCVCPTIRLYPFVSFAARSHSRKTFDPAETLGGTLGSRDNLHHSVQLLFFHTPNTLPSTLHSHVYSSNPNTLHSLRINSVILTRLVARSLEITDRFQTRRQTGV